MKALATTRPPGNAKGGDRRLWKNVWLIVSVALLLRLGWAFLVPVDPVSDSVLYDAFAKEIAFGKGYAFPGGNLTVYWPVGASAVYATLYVVFGTSGWVPAIFQAVLGALIVGLTWRLAHQYFDLASAALAGWFVALWPLLIQFTTILASELIFLVLLLGALNVWGEKKLRPVARALFWGALIAGATYVRPTAWPLLLIFPVCAWLADRNTQRAAVTLLVSTLTAALLFAPWMHRNYQLFDSFVLVAANGGPNLWMGNNPDSNGGYMALPEHRSFANEVERDRHFGREAVAFITSNPLEYLRLAQRRTVMTYDRESIGVVWNEKGIVARLGTVVLQPLKAVSSAYWWAVLLLGTLGVAQTLRRRDRAAHVWPVLVALIFFAIVPVLTVGQDRYHVPINPLLAIFAGHAVLSMLRKPASNKGEPRDA